jgi:hypothetical protein
MVRNVKSAPDARVKDFFPDSWQRELLDVVDAQQSAMIVAPTSSGKTFISFYCMKKIIDGNLADRRNRRKLVVYVCPTKALCRQVAADIFRRYGAVDGLLTLDFNRPGENRKVLDCSVLICLPRGLEYLLLTATHQDLVARIAYVIFDEVHCIGQPDMDGRTWERLLLATQSPILALSATVGNSAHFHAWLAAVEQTKGRELTLIVHDARWSDLEKYIYLPRQVDPAALAELTDLHAFRPPVEQQSLQPIHPCVALCPGLGLDQFDVSHGVPSELAFSPSDALALYKGMVDYGTRHLSAALRARLAALDPDIALKDVPRQYVDKTAAQAYVQRLKAELSEWVASGYAPAAAAVFEGLSDAVTARIRVTEQAFLAAGQDPYSSDALHRHFFALLLELHAQRRLPGLVFCLDEDVAEKLVLGVLRELERRQELAHGSSDAKRDQKRVRELGKLISSLRAREGKDRKDADTEQVGGGGDAQLAGWVAELAELQAKHDPLLVDCKFSFLKETERMPSADFEFWLDRVLRKTGWTRAHPYIRALARGIGLHHDGLSKAYRELVEVMFRGRHLKVVVSTETLAMGINMPCRSVCFAGDYRLTPLLYQQMAGRAGRRGFDDVGHVTFFGVPPRRAFRLIKSPLASLGGYFPVTTSLVLRLLQLAQDVKRPDDALAMCRPLVEQPFLVCPPAEKAAAVQQARMQFRFAVQYLRLRGLLDNQGRTCGLANLITHVPNYETYTQSSSDALFAFTYVLERGVLDTLCADFTRRPVETCKQLLLVLAHFFNRIPLPRTSARAEHCAEVKGTAEIVLPPLPAEVREVVDEHNRGAVALYSDFLHTFARSQSEGAGPTHGEQLPLSGLCFPPVGIQEANETAAGTAIDALWTQAKSAPVLARCPFAALSGHTDQFGSLEEAADSLRHPLKFHAIAKHAEPVGATRDLRFHEVPLNAYILDLFTHGNVQKMLALNHLDDKAAYRYLINWTTLLALLIADLEKLTTMHERPDKRPGLYRALVHIRENLLKRVQQLKAQSESKVRSD